MIKEIYGINVLTLDKIKVLLSESTYNALLDVIKNGGELEGFMADEVANAMKEWAIERGVTHFTHWFQPLNGLTAEKHDSFFAFDKNENVILELKGKELIKGESDASSFPSGGLRDTFEARGYMSWDVTSPAFVQGHTLYIPSLFYSYTGEVLDQKTTLIRASERLSEYSVRLLNLLGDNQVRSVKFEVGAEQEYFLIDKDLYDKRYDLKTVGRTLMGRTSKEFSTSQMNYLGKIDDRVDKFMLELDQELWKLGIPAKTEHNENAPMQHELAVIHTDVNVACDNNQLIMEIMQKIAKKNNFVCLLHEKPFSEISGSGKHNNWSIKTDTGKNLFKVTNDELDNIELLTFISALVRGIDLHSDLLIASISNASNDLRLGGFEAPPSIISVFLGDELLKLLDLIIEEKGSERVLEKSKVKLGISKLQTFDKDTEDRNRTSPLAFTGNKFEFRMVGSSLNISFPNVVLMTLMVESLDYIYKKIRKSKKPAKDVLKVCKSILKEHGRVIYNGDNYSREWYEEAVNRKLYIGEGTVNNLKAYDSENTIELFEKYGILSKKEILAKKNVELEEYVRKVSLEVKTFSEMMCQYVIPTTYKYMSEVSKLALNLKELLEGEDKKAREVSLFNFKNELKDLGEKVYAIKDGVNFLNVFLETESSKLNKEEFDGKLLRRKMDEIRKLVDDLEMIVPYDIWNLPRYSELLLTK